MNFVDVFKEIESTDKSIYQKAFEKWDAIAKPLRSLGILEEVIAQIAAIKGKTDYNIQKSAVIVMCADNGVVAEGVTQTGQEVTAIVSENMVKGDTSVCAMARVAGADVIPVDVGVCRKLCDGVLDKCIIRGGTRNMTKEPAMTREECIKAIEVGINIAIECCGKGYDILITGEMGIGNTTTSSAIAAVLLNKPIHSVVGRGAGLSSEGLSRKVGAIEKAINVNKPNINDPIDVLAKVGGLDIAGLVGVYLGCATCKTPVLVDGFISAVSALAACRICPKARDYLIATHISKEHACKMLLDELELKPFIDAEMCLGEGTGAVAALPLIKMAHAVYGGMTTFEDTNIETYVPLD